MGGARDIPSLCPKTAETRFLRDARSLADAYGRAVAFFLAERYLSRRQALDIGRRRADPDSTRLTAEVVADPGCQLVMTLAVPEDEVCYYVFDAKSREEVSAAAARAGVTLDRITAATADMSPTRMDERGPRSEVSGHTS